MKKLINIQVLIDTLTNSLTIAKSLETDAYTYIDDVILQLENMLDLLADVKLVEEEGGDWIVYIKSDVIAVKHDIPDSVLEKISHNDFYIKEE